MGLVQLLREVPCPDVMARHLLNMALEDFHESAHHYLMLLVAKREKARQNGDVEAITALDTKIHEHALNEQLPQRWRLDFVFSRAVYETCGDGVFAVWATILIEICTLEQHWEGVLLGLPQQNPYLLPGHHCDEAVRDTAWLDEAQKSWSGELPAVLKDAASVLEVVTLPRKPSTAREEHHDVSPKELELTAAEASPWLM